MDSCRGSTVYGDGSRAVFAGEELQPFELDLALACASAGRSYNCAGATTICICLRLPDCSTEYPRSAARRREPAKHSPVVRISKLPPPPA